MLSLALREGAAVEKKYWIARKRASMAMARHASSSEARLIHYELAGRYSIKAAAVPAFLHAPAPAPAVGVSLQLPAARRDPDPS